MQTIHMPHGLTTIIDDEDSDLARYKWSRANTGYAQSNIGKRKVVHLHRLIAERMAGHPLGRWEIVDHINRNPLDNRRANIRITTQSSNLANRDPQSNNKSGVSGIYWFKKYQRWHVRIKVQGKTIHIGYYADFEEAKQARIEAEKKYFGFVATK